MANEYNVTLTTTVNTEVVLGTAVAYAVTMSQPGPPGSGLGAQLQDYSILAQLPSWAGAESVDLANGNVVQPALTGNVSSVAITGWAASGIESKIVFYIPQGATPYTVTGWPAAVKWAGGIAPVLSSVNGAVDVIVLSTVDGGTTILGFNLGTAF